jgi:hypothetical protein
MFTKAPQADYIAPATTARDVALTDILADIARGETPFSLAELPKQPFVPRKNGRKLHPSTAFRWAQRGVRGQRLEVARCGGALCTTPSAVARFFARLSGAAAIVNRTPTRAQSARRLDRVECELAKEGL